MNQWQKATCESESCCVKQLFHHGPAWRAQENKDGVPSFADFQFAVQIKSAQKGVWLAFNKTCIMLIFLKQWWPPAALSFPSKLHGRFYLERTGKWWLQHAAWHKKEAKLHIIMFNTTFQWAISSFWNSGMVYFFSPGLEVLPRYPFIPVLRMTEMKWAAGKGVTATRRFIWMAEKRLKTQLSSLALRLLSTFLLPPLFFLHSILQTFWKR